MSYKFFLPGLLLAICMGNVGFCDDADIAKLIKQLDSDKADQQEAAIIALGDEGAAAKSAVSKLSSFLNKDDESHSWLAARSLAAIGPAAKEAVPALTKQLSSKQMKARAYAAFALGEIGEASKPAVPELAKLVADKDAVVRRAALQALKEIKPGPKVGIPLLVKVLEDAKPEVVTQALHTLAEYGKEVVPFMIEALKNKKAQYWACLVLADIGPDAKAAVPALTELLKTDEPELRLQVYLTLAAIGKAAKPAIPSLLEAMSEEKTGNCFCAAYAVAKIGADGFDKELQATQDSEYPLTRMMGAYALSQNHPEDKKLAALAVKHGLEALKDNRSDVRELAARMVVELEPPTGATTEALVAALKDIDDSAKANIFAAMAANGEKAVPRLITRLKIPALHAPAATILAMIGPDAKAAVPALVEALNSKTTAQREIAHALAAIGPNKDAVRPLINLLSADSPEVKYAACYALGKAGADAKDATPVLQSQLKSEDPILRTTSVWALLQIQGKSPKLIEVAVPLLTKALSAESIHARVEAARSLGEIGAPAKSALPELQKLLEDENPLVQATAKNAIKKLN